MRKVGFITQVNDRVIAKRSDRSKSEEHAGSEQIKMFVEKMITKVGGFDI